MACALHASNATKKGAKKGTIKKAVSAKPTMLSAWKPGLNSNVSLLMPQADVAHAAGTISLFMPSTFIISAKIKKILYPTYSCGQPARKASI